jgi:hypothetical protein
MLLIVHLLIGYRRLQGLRDHHDDPMVQRVLGLRRLPVWPRSLEYSMGWRRRQ